MAPITIGTALITGIRGPCSSQKETPPQYPFSREGQPRLSDNNQLHPQCLCVARGLKRAIDPKKEDKQTVIETYLQLWLLLTWGMSGNHQKLPHTQATCRHRGHREGDCGGKALPASTWRKDSERKLSAKTHRNTTKGRRWWFFLLIRSLPVCTVSCFHMKILTCTWSVNLGLCGISVPVWSLLCFLEGGNSCCESTTKSICNY